MGCVFRRFWGEVGFDVGFDRLFIFLGRELAAKLQQAVEIFDCMAIEALGLGLETEECGGDIGLPGVAIEAEGEPVGAVLIGGDFDAFAAIGMIEDLLVHGALIEAVGEEAGFEC